MLVKLSREALEQIELQRKANTKTLDYLRCDHRALACTPGNSGRSLAYRNVRVAIAKLERTQIALAEILDAKPIDLHDVSTHRHAWQSALTHALESCPPATEDMDDFGYWTHEIATFRRTFDQLESLIK